MGQVSLFSNAVFLQLGQFPTPSPRRSRNEEEKKKKQKPPV